VKHYTMTDIRCHNKTVGHHWFDADTLRFFRGRVCDSTLAQGPGGVYFVSSEQFSASSRRLYSVRRYDPATGHIDTVGEFQGYSSRAAAASAAQRLAGDKLAADVASA
jgi:hypothetical protein